MKRDIRDYLQDIIDAIDNGAAFIKGMGYEDFIADTKTSFAVIRAIEVIGEAARNIPEEERSRHPNVPWKELTGMRNKLIHAYFGADMKRVWTAMRDEIPPLKPLFEAMLRRLNGREKK